MISNSTTINKRRESMTSASAPAGSVKRKSGRLTATCTSETASGLALSEVIIQPEAVSKTAVPRLEMTLAVQIAVKAAWLKAPQRSGAGPAAVAAGVVSAFNGSSAGRGVLEFMAALRVFRKCARGEGALGGVGLSAAERPAMRSPSPLVAPCGRVGEGVARSSPLLRKYLRFA